MYHTYSHVNRKRAITVYLQLTIWNRPNRLPIIYHAIIYVNDSLSYILSYVYMVTRIIFSCTVSKLALSINEMFKKFRLWCCIHCGLGGESVDNSIHHLLITVNLFTWYFIQSIAAAEGWVFHQYGYVTDCQVHFNYDMIAEHHWIHSIEIQFAF